MSNDENGCAGNTMNNPTGERRGAFVLGVERIGLISLAWPRATIAATVLIIVLSLAFIASRLSFDGNFDSLLKSEASAYTDVTALERDYRSFSDDEVLIVQSPDLATVEGFERFRQFQIELKLATGVGNVLSVFSLASPTVDGNGWQPTLPDRFQSDEQLRTVVDGLREELPSIRTFLDLEGGSALLIVMPDTAMGSSGFSQDALAELALVLESFNRPDFEISFVGRPTIQRDLVNGIKRDQILLTSIAVLICAIISFLLFRSAAAALLCTVPPLVALIAFLGLQAVLGVRIDYLTTVIPVLLIVLVFADGLHLFFHWRRGCENGAEPLEALRHSILDVGPACALANLTTAIAFVSLLIASNEALAKMAYSGIAAVVIGYVVTVVVLPAGIWLVVRCNLPFRPARWPMLQSVGRLANGLLARRRRLLAAMGIVVAGALLSVHFTVPGQYRLTDYIPFDSQVRRSLEIVDRSFGGSAQLFVIVDRAQPADRLLRTELDELARIEQAIGTVIGPNRSMSLALARRSATFGSDGIDLSQPTIANHPMMRWFISRGLDKLLISAFVPQGLTALEMDQLVDRIEKEIAAAGISGRITVTGGPVLRARVIPMLIDDLRHGLLLSIGLSILVIGVALGSWRLGLACIVPNVLPILLAESTAWVLAGGIDMTSAIALTVGFGLAVDDSVHLLNQYALERSQQEAPDVAMSNSLTAVSPALVATTVVFSVGMVVTFFSSLPTVALFGTIIIGILFFALVADLLLLPANVILVEKPRDAAAPLTR